MENADKIYNVVISEQASEMLISHSRFLAEVSEEAARNLVDDFRTAIKSLENFPDRNAWLYDAALPNNKYRKLLFGKRYLLIYQTRNSNVLVDYVLDCRQDYGWLL